MKLHQGPVFIDGMVNSTEVVVHSKTNFVQVVQNQLFFPETIDAVCQLILQDRYVIYRESNTTLGISGTSVPSILQEHLFPLDPTQFVNRSKKSINQSGKTASTIGSNACKSVQILMGNILKINKEIFND